MQHEVVAARLHRGGRRDGGGACTVRVGVGKCFRAGQRERAR